MKKSFCILLSMILMMCSCAGADHHMEIQLVFSGSMEGKTVSLDFYGKDGSFTVLSNLFPEFALVMDPAEDDFSLADSLSLFPDGPEAFFEAINLADTMLCSWLDKQKNECVTGVFSGDIMDHAKTMCTCRFCLDDMYTYFQQCADTKMVDQETVLIVYNILSACCAAARKLITEDRLFINAKSFDDRNYITLGIYGPDDLMMNVSIDHTGLPDDRHLLISWHEEEKYCFFDMHFRTKDDCFAAETSYYSGEKDSFRNMKSNRPLFSESLNIAKEKEHKCFFEYQLKTDSLADPFIISGHFEKTGDASYVINAYAQIIGVENEQIIISASLKQLQRSVSFSDKKIMHASDEKVSTELMISAVSSLTLLSAEILPVLPEDYQKLILCFLYR